MIIEKKFNLNKIKKIKLNKMSLLCCNIKWLYLIDKKILN